MDVRNQVLTPADVERMLKCGEIDPDARWELVDGEIVWLAPTNWYHAQVVVAVAVALVPFAKQIGAAVLGGDPGFIVGSRHQQLRGPDVALVTKDRLTIFDPAHPWGSEAPDLAVEVLSPEQHGESYAQAKVAEYLAAGGTVVWLVDPDNRTVRVYERGASEHSIYPADNEMTLDAIAPGFSVTVSSFFP
jgi:Uma2 family endonuclease